MTTPDHNESSASEAANAPALPMTIKIDPANPVYRFKPGNIQLQTGQPLLTKPNEAESEFYLGNEKFLQGRLGEASEHYRKSLQLNPGIAAVHSNFGNVLMAQNQLHEAVACFRQALLLKPDVSETHNNLGNALMVQGHLDESAECYHQALLLQPDYAVAFSNLLFTLQNMPTWLPEKLYMAHQRYAERFEAPLKPLWQPHPNSREPERRLKVGYVSGDFRQHAVAYFIEPILACHDKTQFEVFGYFNDNRPDLYTERLAAHADHWLLCPDLSDEQLAQRIRLDAIDILVDLSGHTAHNRLLVFARKPAPVQATYIGYPDTTGLATMDYRITDPWLDPPGLTERYHSETLVRIPGGMAFQPDPGAPAVNALPALTSGEFMLASFNNIRKVNPAVIHLWARILHALPKARLMLGNAADSGTRERLIELFGRAGIGPERLVLQPAMSSPDYLAAHHQIDLGLDPFPYNGTTTTMFTLWMGVPVITLAGNNAKSLCGVSLMSRVDLPEFICQTEDAYVQCAVKFANDLPALNAVRQSLRTRMTAPECQPATITRQLEAAYREMWQKWCGLSLRK